MSVLGRTVRFYVSFFGIIIFILVAIWLSIGVAERNPERVLVEFDETVIVERIQSLNQLQSASVIVQRDIEVSLDLGDIQFQGFTLLESKKSQKLAATGRVIAGIDLEDIDPEKVVLEDDILTIELPQPEILAIELDESKTTLLREDWTLLFGVESFISGRRQELNEQLRDQVAEQTRKALLDGACEADILDRANESAQESIENLFLFVDLESVEVSTAEAVC